MTILYKQVKARALSIVRHDNEEYIIMEFDHVHEKVMLFKCDIDKEIADMKKKGEYFIYLTDKHYGHAIHIYTDGMKRKEEWIRKSISYLDDFEVIYEH